MYENNYKVGLKMTLKIKTTTQIRRDWIINENNEKWIKLNSMLDYLNGWLATDLTENETKLIDLIYKDIEGEKKKITDA